MFLYIWTIFVFTFLQECRLYSLFASRLLVFPQLSLVRPLLLKRTLHYEKPTERTKQSIIPEKQNSNSKTTKEQCWEKIRGTTSKNNKRGNLSGVPCKFGGHFQRFCYFCCCCRFVICCLRVVCASSNNSTQCMYIVFCILWNSAPITLFFLSLSSPLYSALQHSGHWTVCLNVVSGFAPG